MQYRTTSNCISSIYTFIEAPNTRTVNPCDVGTMPFPLNPFFYILAQQRRNFAMANIAEAAGIYYLCTRVCKMPQCMATPLFNGFMAEAAVF